MYDWQLEGHPRLLPPRVGFGSQHPQNCFTQLVHSRRYVIHTVGPVYSPDAAEEKARQLASCYRTSMELAVENQVRHIVSLYLSRDASLSYPEIAKAFPSVSTGIYGYPIVDATRVALDQVRRFVES